MGFEPRTVTLRSARWLPPFVHQHNGKHLKEEEDNDLKAHSLNLILLFCFGCNKIFCCFLQVVKLFEFSQILTQLEQSDRTRHSSKQVLQIKNWTVLYLGSAWPDWAIVERSWQQIFVQKYPKCSPSFWTCLKDHKFYVKTIMVNLWVTFEEKLGFFLLRIWSHCLGFNSVHANQLTTTKTAQENWRSGQH